MIAYILLNLYIRAVFKEDTMAHVLGEGIKMYVLDISGAEKFHPIDPEEYQVLIVLYFIFNICLFELFNLKKFIVIQFV